MNLPSLGLASCALVLGACSATGAPPEGAPTVENPIAITLAPAGGAVRPGASSSLVLALAIPEGMWIGAAEGPVRAPGPTRLELEPARYLEFGPARWPRPSVEGIPVRLGTTRVYKGRVTVVIPFRVAADCPPGPRRVVARLTYVPGFDAGHLTPHLRERVPATVVVAPEAAPSPSPEPAVATAPGLSLAPYEPSLPPLLRPMFFRPSEDSATARALHATWLDPPDHGKHVQGMLHPFAAGNRNSGASIGAGVALINTTREGVGTGMVDARLFENEYAGVTAAIDAVSCPAAFHNYWVHAFQSQNGDRGLGLHTEDLTLAGGAVGYELSLAAFEDGRFRFFGLGPRSRERDETAFTHQELSGAADVFWTFATGWRLGLGGRVRNVGLDDPTERLAQELPSTLDVFPALAGVEGGTVGAVRATLVLDRRNQEFTPSRGTYVRARAELDENLDDGGQALEDRWGRFELLARQYWSTPGDRYTLLLQNRWEHVTQSNIPFWELPGLGGADTLRAFDSGRFVGQSSVLASAELRIQAMHTVVLGMPMDVELAPFVDTGQVFDAGGLGGPFHVNPGLSMRILNRPNVGIVVNVASGRDGPLFTGSVGLPF